MSEASSSPPIVPSDESQPIIKVRLGKDGRPLGAAALARIERPIAEVWAAIEDIERYVRHLPMVHRVRREGNRLTIDLRFKIGLFGVGFQFTADAVYEPGRSFDLRWVSGEPKDVRLRLSLAPLDDGRACLVEGDGEFDLYSLGWLTKYFLRHHPEIQYGIFPGVALVLIDALRRATGPASHPGD
jgi:hypothetical protein